MDTIIVKKRTYVFDKLLHNDDLMSASFVYYKKKKYVLREFKNSESYLDALKRYEKLVSSGIYVPKLVRKDKNTFKLVFEYIDGDNCASVLSKEDLSDEYFDALFLQYRFCRFSKIELDYIPENFVYFKKKLYYISLKVFEQNKNINLENHGLQFFLPSRNGLIHLKNLGYEVDFKRELSNAETNKKIVLTSIKHW